MAPRDIPIEDVVTSATNRWQSYEDLQHRQDVSSFRCSKRVAGIVDLGARRLRLWFKAWRYEGPLNVSEVTINSNWSCFRLNNLSYKIRHQNAEPWAIHPDHVQSHQLPYKDSLQPASALAYSSTLKMEAICSYETSGCLRITRSYNPEDRTLQTWESFDETELKAIENVPHVDCKCVWVNGKRGKEISDGEALSADERLSPRDILPDDINISLVAEMKNLCLYQGN
jgi:hypothetical protein